MLAWKTNRKIIIIESDDWGSIRMPSKVVFNKMLEKGIKVDQCAYNTYDSLASHEDLEALYTVLLSFNDKNDKHPVITANAIMANPNFEKIAKSEFNEYFYEPFTETLKRQFPSQDVFQVWKKGMSLGVFHPQFHGREHLHIKRWMLALKEKLPETTWAFKNHLFGLSTTITSEKRKSYMAAFDLDNDDELEDQKKIISDGLNLFEQSFGYKSLSFIAPNYTWNSLLEPTLKELGVHTIQGARAQREPRQGLMHIKKYVTGKKNKLGLNFLIRNVTFEPSLDQHKDWLNSALSQVSNAFFWKTPAIISSHRLNYIGSLNKSNRDNNLLSLKKLLSEIIKKWPDVEFMTSDQLGEILNKNST